MEIIIKKVVITIGLIVVALTACLGAYGLKLTVNRPSITVSSETSPENIGEVNYDFTVLSSSISKALSDFGVEVGIETTEGTILCENMDLGEEYEVTLKVDVVGESKENKVTLSQTRVVVSEGDSFKLKYSVDLPNGLDLENLTFTSEKVK